ncbi:hypothetical protein PVA44_03200 [Entomospira nematocerorum]|uniref:Tetratricopeptide repeat protein n=1 Tax=Entomospira nematocerorum TaxID=2719987 RepID=A0A968GCY3_9SPIO|nr:hypothetical protein [Entomospira nematocera]NIZ46959.1 hypothetical protein [Entomospira nematocera]WDI34495.1 hypothetical protein PVA44_03200 [Entomospira nematocera]
MKRVLQSLLVMSIYLIMTVTLSAQSDANILSSESVHPVTDQVRSSTTVWEPSLTNIRADVYPNFHDKWQPMSINYEILDGLSNNILNSPVGAFLQKRLHQYAFYYQAPWYFHDFSTQDVGINATLRVRFFSDIIEFRNALSSITDDYDFSSSRHDFITVEEQDGSIVLYLYGLQDPMRMDQLLARLGFIQFATVYLPLLPHVLRTGFSLYFEDIDLSLAPQHLIRNRTFLKNIKEVESLYLPVITEDILEEDEEYLLTDNMLFAWLIVNYMYEAYDHQATFFTTRAEAFQSMLEMLLYEPDSLTYEEAIRINNHHFVSMLEECIGAQIQQTLDRHLNMTLNHYQAYMAGLYAFENRDLERAKNYFIESAFALREYYQPRYAIARIALYQADLLANTLIELEHKLSRASAIERKGYEMEIQVVQKDINKLMQQAHEYFGQAKALIEHHLAYRHVSVAMRQELEAFHERIMDFNNTYDVLVPFESEMVAFTELPTADGLSYRY